MDDLADDHPAAPGRRGRVGPMKVRRGRLGPPSDAPVSGERTDELAAGPGWRVEQILSGKLPAPIDDLLDHEEWVMVVAGGAVLEVDGVAETLGAGDWILLGRGVPHRVVSTEPGTSWLAVHLPPTA